MKEKFQTPVPKEKELPIPIQFPQPSTSSSVNQNPPEAATNTTTEAGLTSAIPTSAANQTPGGDSSRGRDHRGKFTAGNKVAGAAKSNKQKQQNAVASKVTKWKKSIQAIMQKIQTARYDGSLYHVFRFDCK